MPGVRMTDPVRRPKLAWRPLDGVLLLDKPLGLSSNDALQRVRRALRAASGGHGGTLDPLATGLLPLAFGEATKFLHDLLEADKTYHATVALGVRTQSGDAEGQEVSRQPVPADLTEATVREACQAFTGPILQVPPMHSALKHHGRPLYELARAGQTIERRPREVTVHALSVAGTDLASGLFEFDARVSKGTYIRTLAQDIGERLGCGAHLKALRRTAVGRLQIAQAVTLEHIESLDEVGRERLLAPVDALLEGLPVLRLPESLAVRFTQGQRIILDHALRADLSSNYLSATSRSEGGEQSLIRVYRNDQLLGVAEFEPPGRIAPRRLVRLASA